MRMFCITAVSLFMTTTVLAQQEEQESCGGDWNCWNMYTYDEIPILTNDDPNSPGYYDENVPSPLLIYLHSNGPYGESGLGEENFWLRLWPESYDGYTYYPGLENWPVEYIPEGGGEAQQTGWIYAIPNGAQDTPQNAVCATNTGEGWPFWRYWNATPNCCAYNWYVDDSYTEVSYGAPDHATYINNFIAWAKRNYNVDENRVYVYGYSNGGYMCHRLACENGNYGYYGYSDEAVDPSGAIIPPQPIAAVATYAGVTFMNPENCNGVWPTNVLHTHDIGDQACLYNGGLDTDFAGACYPGYPRPYPGAIATVSSWIFMNQTTGEGELLESVVPFDLAVPYSMAQVIDWPNGRYGSRVQHWRGLFGSHGATFSSEYRNRLIEWFIDNPRPNYLIEPNEKPCVGDLDENGVVNGADLGILFVQWGGPGTADFDGTGTVNGIDVGIMLSNWGTCPE